MSQPYIGEMRMFGFNFPPRGWALCNGQLMAIQQYQALFSILGTTYGGDGIRTFQLPNLQGCVPMHRSNTYTQGTYIGEENHTLTLAELPGHNHTVTAMSTPATVALETNNLLAAASGGQNLYVAPATTGGIALAPLTVSIVGGSQPHPNQQPYVVLNACIALQGVFPSRN